MRILHAILSTHFAGSEAHCCWLASEQARMGHTVAVVIRDAAPGYVERFRRDAAPAAVKVLPAWVPGALESLGCWPHVRRFRPDIIHTHLGRATSRLARLRRSAPHVATLHINWRRQYAHCDAVICIAGWQRKEIPESFKGRVAVIWNSVPPRYPVASQRPADTVCFLSVGRLIPNKGMDVLIRAFQDAFPQSGVPVSLVIAGDGPELPALRGLAGDDRRIKLLGHVDDVGALYDQAHVYVSAARFEPFGLTILEAMQAGCQLICSKTQGPVEFLAGYDLAWVECGDTTTLAAALRKFAQTPVTSRTWDLTPFEPRRAAVQIEALYRTCLADGDKA